MGFGGSSGSGSGAQQSEAESRSQALSESVSSLDQASLGTSTSGIGQAGVPGATRLFTGSVVPAAERVGATQFNAGQGLTSGGLFPQQEQALGNIARDEFSGLSGNAATRGFVSPKNIPGLVGSTLRNLGPLVFQTAGQNIRDRAGFPVLQAQGISNLAQTIPGVLGTQGANISQTLGRSQAQSQSQAESQSFGFGSSQNQNFGLQAAGNVDIFKALTSSGTGGGTP